MAIFDKTNIDHNCRVFLLELAERLLLAMPLASGLQLIWQRKSHGDLLIGAIVSSLSRISPGNEIDLRIGAHPGRR